MIENEQFVQKLCTLPQLKIH